METFHSQIAPLPDPCLLQGQKISDYMIARNYRQLNTELAFDFILIFINEFLYVNVGYEANVSKNVSENKFQ